MDNKFFIQCLEDYIRKDYESFIEFMKEKGFSSIDVDSFDFDNLIGDDKDRLIELERITDDLEDEIRTFENKVDDYDLACEDYKDEIEELEEQLKNLRLIVEEKESSIKSLEEYITKIS